MAQGQAQLDAGAQELDAAKARLELGKRQAEASQGVRFVSEDGQAAVAQVQFNTSINALTPAVRRTGAVPDSGGSHGRECDGGYRGRRGELRCQCGVGGGDGGRIASRHRGGRPCFRSSHSVRGSSRGGCAPRGCCSGS